MQYIGFLTEIPKQWNETRTRRTKCWKYNRTARERLERGLNINASYRQPRSVQEVSGHDKID